MIVAIALPRFPLLVAMLANGIALDTPAALAPRPGAAQLVGMCTRTADIHGVRPGLRVGEAIARCPDLVLDPAGPRRRRRGPRTGPDPARGARRSRRIRRARRRVLRRHRAGAAPRGAREHAAPRAGGAPRRRQWAHRGRADALCRPAGRPPGAPPHAAGHRPHDIDAFLAPLPVGRLPLPQAVVDALWDVGIRTIGAVAALPRAAALERMGFEGAARLAHRARRGRWPAAPPHPARAPGGALPLRGAGRRPGHDRGRRPAAAHRARRYGTPARRVAAHPARARPARRRRLLDAPHRAARGHHRSRSPRARRARLARGRSAHPSPSSPSAPTPPAVSPRAR